MNALEDHAIREFQAAGWIDSEGNYNDEMQKYICNHILELLKVFSKEGHSGFSAPYAINLFAKLANFEPIVPLTGEEWEWNDLGNGVFQNKRCSHVFKDTKRFDGQAYDIEAVIFCGRDHEEKYTYHFTNSDSARPITFPYTPKKQYVESK